MANVGVVDDVHVVPQRCRCVDPMTMHQSLRTTPHNAFSLTTGPSPMRRRRKKQAGGVGGRRTAVAAVDLPLTSGGSSCKNGGGIGSSRLGEEVPCARSSPRRQRR